jgi:hypothetical protein
LGKDFTDAVQIEGEGKLDHMIGDEIFTGGGAGNNNNLIVAVHGFDSLELGEDSELNAIWSRTLCTFVTSEMAASA